MKGHLENRGGGHTIPGSMLAHSVKRAWLGGILIAAVALAIAGAGSGAPLSPDNWSGWGNTPDQNRHSPLTSITADNVAQLGRVFTVDFRKIDTGIKRGEQSYPLAIDGRLYVTTGDDNVFAVDGVTGAVIWRWKPDNVAVFRNFGIVANRGVAYCDGKLFITTLDMHIVSLDVRTGKLIKRVAIADAVPGAASNFGYSETSAPICANGHVVIGAAGSEYGVRGFVMAYDTNLTPAWPNPFWTIPPEGTSWRKLSPHRRRRRRLDAADDRPDHEHALLRHRLGDAALLPAVPARPEPAHRLADRGRPPHGADEVVAAADGVEPVGLRHRAAAARLHGQGRRQDATGRLGGDDGGRLVRLRRDDGRADLPADQGDRPHRAPAAPAGQAGHGVPVLARRPQLLAGVVRPEDELPPQRRRRDGVRAAAGEADADPEEAEARPGQRLPRASRTATSASTCRAGTTTARSARSTSTRASASGSSRRPSRSAAA